MSSKDIEKEKVESFREDSLPILGALEYLTYTTEKRNPSDPTAKPYDIFIVEFRVVAAKNVRVKVELFRSAFDKIRAYRIRYPNDFFEVVNHEKTEKDGTVRIVSEWKNTKVLS